MYTSILKANFSNHHCYNLLLDYHKEHATLIKILAPIIKSKELQTKLHLINEYVLQKPLPSNIAQLEDAQKGVQAGCSAHEDLKTNYTPPSFSLNFES